MRDFPGDDVADIAESPTGITYDVKRRIRPSQEWNRQAIPSISLDRISSFVLILWDFQAGERASHRCRHPKLLFTSSPDSVAHEYQLVKVFLAHSGHKIPPSSRDDTLKVQTSEKSPFDIFEETDQDKKRRKTFSK